MNNRATEHAPTPTFTLRNLHFGRFVAVAKSNKQSGMLDGGAEWVIATELPASLRTALDVEPRPEASLGRLCISDEPRAALVTVSTEDAELYFILPLGDSRTQVWLSECARVGLLAIVLVVNRKEFPFGVQVRDFTSLQEFWMDGRGADATNLSGGALAEECANLTGLLMAQHMNLQREQEDSPRDRHYVLVSNEAFSGPMGDAFDMLVNAFLASELTAEAATTTI